MKKIFLAIIIQFIFSSLSWAVNTQETTVKDKAFIKKSSNGYYKMLDLKKKIVVFENEELESCLSAIEVNWKKMIFRCKFKINSSKQKTKLFKQLTPKKMSVELPHVSKFVKIQVSKSTRYVTYSTSFDRLGIDLDEAVFNNDLKQVYAQIASQVITKAMKTPLEFTTLE